MSKPFYEQPVLNAPYYVPTRHHALGPDGQPLNHPSSRKLGGGLIRDAAERFCKEILIKARRAKGDAAASLNDYERKNLGDLVPKVEPLLTFDPSHAGKLRAIGGAVNPAKHDDAVPAAGVLKVALGDLRSLRKEYL
jgi:hypothetical protein